MRCDVVMLLLLFASLPFAHTETGHAYTNQGEAGRSVHYNNIHAAEPNGIKRERELRAESEIDIVMHDAPETNAWHLRFWIIHIGIEYVGRSISHTQLRCVFCGVDFRSMFLSL